jgi:hypothetical protein
MLHWQLPKCVAAVAGIDTAPQPHEVHGSFLKPFANDPSEHGLHEALAVAPPTIPCPGTHTHSVSFVVPTDIVVLFAAHCVHSVLLLNDEKKP